MTTSTAAGAPGLPAATAPAREPRDPVPDPAIEAVDLVKRYRDVTAVGGVSLRVPRATIFAYLGRNGSGKSTTVRILTTLSAPTAGTARVAGYDLTDAANVRARIGVTMQEAALDPTMTAVEHLRLVAGLSGLRSKAAGALADELLAGFGLAGAAGRRIGTFSGGMQRRLDIASALVGRPPVLFLDEPTTGLDPQSRRALWAHLRELRDQGTTMFLTTQYLEEADELADRVAVIDSGTLVAEDTADRLKARFGRTRLVLDHDGDPDRLRAALPGRDVEAERPGRSVVVLDGGAEVLAVLERVRAAGIGIGALSVSAPSLEDVYLRLTGSAITTGQDQLAGGGQADRS
jgi:ABC-2 type transport system ATP-binding protein